MRRMVMNLPKMARHLALAAKANNLDYSKFRYIGIDADGTVTAFEKMPKFDNEDRDWNAKDGGQALCFQNVGHPTCPIKNFHPDLAGVRLWYVGRKEGVDFDLSAAAEQYYGDYGIALGSKVRLVAKTKNREFEWPAGWTEEMEDYVGKEGRVIEIKPEKCLKVAFPRPMESPFICWLPYMVVEPVDDDELEEAIAKYKAEVKAQTRTAA